MSSKGIRYKQKTKIRHFLKKHQKMQKIGTELYLKYCTITGFLHVMPDYCIIGFPKCGTTSLHEYLNKHPDVYLPIGKEIDFFDRLYSRGQNWYKAAFPLTLKKFYIQKMKKRIFLTGEATPRYIYHPYALERIKKLKPNMKLIILIRNPVDRAFSHYKMNKNNDYEYLDFENALDEEKERIKGRYEKMQKDQKYYSWNYDLYAYIELGQYYEKIKKCFELFDQKQVMIIQSEEFQKNTSDIYKQVLKFLELPKHELSEYKFFKKKNYEGEKMSLEIRKRLEQYFKPYNEKLSKLIEQDIEW